MIKSDGWKIKLPREMCVCRRCMSLHATMQETRKTADALPFLASQAICTGEETSITDPEGTTMRFAPFLSHPGMGWDHDSTEGYAPTIPTMDATPYADLLELDLPKGVN